MSYLLYKFISFILIIKNQTLSSSKFDLPSPKKKKKNEIHLSQPLKYSPSQKKDGGCIYAGRPLFKINGF